MQVLANALVVIILQRSTSTSCQRVVHLDLTLMCQLHLNKAKTKKR